MFLFYTLYGFISHFQTVIKQFSKFKIVILQYNTINH